MDSCARAGPGRQCPCLRPCYRRVRGSAVAKVGQHPLLVLHARLKDLDQDPVGRLPVIISGTVTDASGRILSGQTVPAFWHSVRHAEPLAVGLNCALGAALMRPYIQEIAKVAPDTFISCYPNAGLPNPMAETGFDETPDVTSSLLREFAEEGLVNLVGGCCGTTPEHIRAIVEAVQPLQPRVLSSAAAAAEPAVA